MDVYSRLSVDDLIERERACGVLYGPFWQHKYLDRAPEVVRRSLELSRRFPEIQAARVYQEMGVQQEFPNFAGIAAVTSTTETNLWDPGIWTRIPAGDIEPGGSYTLSFGGIYGNRTTATPTSTWRVRWGTNNSQPPTGTLLGSPSNALYSGAASTAKPFFGEVNVQILSVDGGDFQGFARATGFIMRLNNNAVTALLSVFGDGGSGSTQIDNSIDAGLCITHVWSAANANNTLTCQWAILRSPS